MKKLRKKRLSQIQKYGEQMCCRSIYTHYFQDLVTNSVTSEQLYSRTVAELGAYLGPLGTNTPLSYLVSQWYFFEDWKTWDRKEIEEVSLPRTTTKSEVHWSILKVLYLQPFNIQRMDLLIHVMKAKVIQKLCDDYKVILHGLKKPCWRKSFLITSNTHWKTRANNNNETDFIRFSRTCSFWETRPFF